MRLTSGLIAHLDSLLLATCLAAATLFSPHRGGAQEEPPFELIGGNVQKRANAVLTLMSFSVTPDATASSLSIQNSDTDNPSITIGQLGAGFTVAAGFPLYMEGFLGYNRFDPTFVASNGQETRRIPTKWNTFSGTAGLGWDFRLFEGLYLRPMANISLGHVESDLSFAARFIEFRTGKDVSFLDNGHLNAYGYGGSVMLDYFRYTESYEIDVELRFTAIQLHSFDSSSQVDGNADAETVSLWSRWRQPIPGMVIFRRPLRYVLELANANYVGSQRGVLGFNFLTSVGGGIEFDFSAYNTIVTRMRLIGRYVFGENVSGVSGGISITFF